MFTNGFCGQGYLTCFDIPHGLVNSVVSQLTKLNKVSPRICLYKINSQKITNFHKKIYFKKNFSALEEFKKISKKTILDLYRHYFMDYIMFGLNSSTIDLLLDDNNLRLPHADLFKRKNSYWANSANREKYQAIRYC